MPRKPTAFCRKIIEISPTLVALWAGDYQAAFGFAKLLQDWFKDIEPTAEGMANFIDVHCRTPIPNFWAILVPAAEPWFYKFGAIYQSTSSFAGEYAVAGSGTGIFKNLVNRGQMSARTEARPDIDGLCIANDLMAQEIVTGATLKAEFGGAYEIFYHGQRGFERIDDIIHYFILAKVESDTIHILHYSNGIRQWYEGNQLYVASFATLVGNEQGIGFKLFPIPSILEEPRDPMRRVDSLVTRPSPDHS
jgi:hypothetical protein